MTSTLDSTGLTIEPKTQIVADLVAAFQAIYGSDINVDSNSPDGQMIGIMAQMTTDFLELLLDAYNSMGVITSYGTRLDQLMALNGIFRKLGTSTIAYVNVTADRALTLPGINQTTQTPFAVSDNLGNVFQLTFTLVISSPVIVPLPFQAVKVGATPTVANTITNIVTPTIGITAVNNPIISGDTIGIVEETDAQLKVRHAQSLALASIGPSDALQAALNNISGVVDAYVVENNTSGTVQGIDPNGIWVIVNGGDPTSIAKAIYAKKSPGAPMKGTQTLSVLRPNGTSFLAKWDNAVGQGLWVGFSIIWRGPQALSVADIQNKLSAALIYRLGQNPNIGDLLSAMAVIAPTAIVTMNSTTQGVSANNSIWASQVQPADPHLFFQLAPAGVVIT